MSDVSDLLEATVARVFTDGVTPERIVEAERGGWLLGLWDAVESNGLLAAHLSEDAGGAGASWREATIVARASGRHAVPLPIAETMLGGWLLERAGVPVPPGPLTVAAQALPAEALDDRTLSARLARVPWGRHAKHVVVTAPADRGVRVAVVPSEGTVVARGHDLALEPRDDLELSAVPITTGDAALPTDVVTLYGAMLRSLQMAGALEAILDLSVQYANERVQFGRPIGQFQAIQQELARLAGLVAAAGVAADVAARAASDAGLPLLGLVGAPGDPTFEIAAAKVVVGDAAELGPRIAHQVHGAIGFTYEHRLHFFTRRLWAWRAEFGTAEVWAERLGTPVLAAGADALWPLVTAR
jgi:acyl-CoA dehydrogenase